MDPDDECTGSDQTFLDDKFVQHGGTHDKLPQVSCCGFTSPFCRRAKKLSKKKLRGGPGSGVNGESRAPGPGKVNLRQSLPTAGIIEESEGARGERGRVGQGWVGFRV